MNKPKPIGEYQGESYVRHMFTTLAGVISTKKGFSLKILSLVKLNEEYDLRHGS
jgi:hypothetical protein